MLTIFIMQTNHLVDW